MQTRVVAGVSLAPSLVLLGLAQLLLTVMRPSVVLPLIFFVSSASVLILFYILSVEHGSRFVRSAAALALAVEGVHLSVALGLLGGAIPPLGKAADANWLVARVLLVVVLIAIRFSGALSNRASFRIATSVAIVIVPASLMCGRPVPCGIARFESARANVFPLTAHDENALREWYP